MKIIFNNGALACFDIDSLNTEALHLLPSQSSTANYQIADGP